jgi:hypothetical protein
MGKISGATNNRTMIKTKLTVKENRMAKVLNACQGFPLHNQDLMANLQKRGAVLNPPNQVNNLT